MNFNIQKQSCNTDFRADVTAPTNYQSNIIKPSKHLHVEKWDVSLGLG